MKVNLSAWYQHIKTNEKTYIPYAILALALAGMLGSLYYSNYGDPVANFKLLEFFPIGAGLVPCRLCWYARILLYPIVPLTLVGIYRRDQNFSSYVLPLAALGIPLEIYHYTIQHLPPNLHIGQCDLFSPCNVSQVTYLGFITIPALGLVAFTLIFLLCLRYKRVCKAATN